ncbi:MULTISPECIES: hypothetical protein [Brevundimonas]|uniref:hypothetical protein n=1 Tax=Brevundimonas TaxID=41275 RepID=UPI000F01B73B|nr:hypothetical protein [Brevundimonas lutea]
MTRTASTAPRFADRYLTVPCDNGLKVIWDRLEEQVVDVIAAPAARYAEEDLLWDEARAPADRDAWRLAA